MIPSTACLLTPALNPGIPHQQPHPVRLFTEAKVLLAELEQNLFKHKHWSGTPQDGEGLSRKQGIGDPGHGGSEQGFNCTLGGRQKPPMSPRPISKERWLLWAPALALTCTLAAVIRLHFVLARGMSIRHVTLFNHSSLIIQVPKPIRIEFLTTVLQ